MLGWFSRKSRQSFKPYVARDRLCGYDRFDFLIADETAKSWYDHTPDQTLAEKIWCRDHISPGFHVVDCGAHHGMMSVLFSRWAGPQGRVTAYELMPSNRKVIAKNLKLNRCTNVKIRPCGVGDRSGNVMFLPSSGNANIHLRGGNAAITHRIPRPSSVRIVALDKDLAGQRIDFIKIDVEGAELAVLRGARQIIAESRPTICLELHCTYFQDREADAIREAFDLVGANYASAALPDILGEVRAVTVADADHLASFDNPHVFFVPT